MYIENTTFFPGQFVSQNIEITINRISNKLYKVMGFIHESQSAAPVGITLLDSQIKYLLFADDLVLLSIEGLKQHLFPLHSFFPCLLSFY